MAASLRSQRSADILALAGRFGAITSAQVREAVFPGLKSGLRLAQQHLAELVAEESLRRDVSAYVPAGRTGPRHKLPHALKLCDLWLALRGEVESIAFEVPVADGRADACARWEGRRWWWEVERGRFDRWDLYAAGTGRALCLWTLTPHALPPGILGAAGTFDEDPKAILSRAKEAVSRGESLHVLRGGAGGLGRGDHPGIAWLPEVRAAGGDSGRPGGTEHDPLAGDQRGVSDLRERLRDQPAALAFDVWGGLR